ncbi:MAG TPA: hypothetical protein VJI52_04220 [Candidatus Nanoarchaeia archaeon]|nr:hypothetical protein [Candidatus Nanoarchaeia archaeon]
MNTKALVLFVLVVGVFLIGCSQSPSGNYAAYNQPQGQQPQGGQYVGGGCGVAPQGSAADTPVGSLVSNNAEL